MKISSFAFLQDACVVKVLIDFFVAVKAAPHECVIRTGQPKT